MKVWKAIKKDLSFYKNAYQSEKTFYKKLWIYLFPDGIHFGSNVTARRPLTQYYGELKSKRIQKERHVAFGMGALLALLTAYLVWSGNWEGFAVWLLFVAMMIRSLVILRILKRKEK